MDRYAQQQAERIDDDMALATRDLLARNSTARRKFRSKSRARQSCAAATGLGRRDHRLDNRHSAPVRSLG